MKVIEDNFEFSKDAHSLEFTKDALLLVGRVETDEISDEIEAMIRASGVTFIRLKAPVASRNYPPDLYKSIRIQDYLDKRVYTEEFRVRQRWFEDRAHVQKFLEEWDRRFTLFFHCAFERVAFEAGHPDDVLDEMAAWLRLPKIVLRMHRDRKTDEEWNRIAVSTTGRRAAARTDSSATARRTTMTRRASRLRHENISPDTARNA